MPRAGGAILLAADYNQDASVFWCCGGAEGAPGIVDGLGGGRGLALLPDGRLAISAGGKVILYRPKWLPAP